MPTNAADWPEEPALYPYHALQALPAQRLLVLAPHPDDEVLGCGGLVAAMLAQGATVQVVIVSDGALGGDAAVRERESMVAAQVLAATSAPPEMVFWHLPDRGLASSVDLDLRLQRLIDSSAPDCVLLPSPFEIHPDHRALCMAGLLAMQASGAGRDLLCYEVGQPLIPDVLVDITAQVERKKAALRCFGSQLAVQAYDEQVLGLNRYRAYTLGPTVTHAEAFLRVSRQELKGGVQSLLDAVDRRLRVRFGFDPVWR
ncbi:MAG: PIG-L family deacetylase [Rubrivivax sp.]|jgi:LmbE family N-acetylglucosaminyl deacetylase|nr:PIG-L family deacetylase [Rubrivivax sp.]